jgi:hypothetical protein
MKQYTILKGIGQVILMRTLKRYLQFVDVVAIASPSPPCPALAQCSQDHKFDIKSFLLFSMETPHYIGFGGLTTMDNITH